MTDSSINVNPGGKADAVPVRTKIINNEHHPVYMLEDETGVKIAYVDLYSGAIGVIDQEHLIIHKGKGFTIASRLVINNLSGAPNNVVDFLGVVPAENSYPHFRKVTITSDGGPVDLDFYEDVTTSDDGVLQTSFNNNRNSSNVASLAVYKTPTITDIGILIDPILIPGTKQQGSLGSDATVEWILKQNTKYLIRITNNTSGGGTSRFTVNMFWYEQ